jgi:mycothiol system anti-sigma-R factor
LSEIDCDEILRQVDFFLSGELPEEDRLHVAQHLADCWDCGDRVEIHVRLREVLARKCGESTSHSLLLRIRSLIETEAEDGTSTA